MNSKKTNSKYNTDILRKLIWSGVFLAIAAVTIWAVSSQSSCFSSDGFISYVSSASVFWLASAVLCMLIYIVFEGEALRCICKGFKYNISHSKGFAYSAADIYFSAITPSASGGQPMCAWFMIKDRIPASVTASALILNLTMYTLSIITIGLISLLLYPGVLECFSHTSKLFIILGIVLQLILALIFVMLLKKSHVFFSIAGGILRFLCKIHLLKNEHEKTEKLTSYMSSYQHCAQMIKDRSAMVFKVFLFNLIQRAASITVTLCTFLACGGNPSLAIHIWAIQSYAVIGSNCIPIPGSMGISDYLMLDGFGKLLSAANAANLELLSRAISFYGCIFLCGATALVRYIIIKKQTEVKL